VHLNVLMDALFVEKQGLNMKKVKRFQEGGFTKEQEEWLGGADRTDPYILARMRRAVPDAPKSEPKVEPKVEPTIKTETKQGQNRMIDDATRLKAVREKAPRYIVKGRSPKSINSDRLVRRDILNQFPDSKSGEVGTTTEYDDAGYKKGGKVKSASTRGDGCAKRGKTKGKMV
jgi:hypothetical protein